MKHIGAIVALLACAGLAFQSCDTGSSIAMGEQDIITVIADSAQYAQMEGVIENAFAPPLFTPQPEQWFHLVRADLLELPNHKREHNILFIAPLDADNDVGEFLRSALDSSVKELVRSGEEYVFVKQDVWYTGQTVMYLTGRSMEELQNHMVNDAQQLFYYFKNAWDKRETARMNRLPRMEKLEEQLMEEHGFSMSIIEGWYMAKDSAEINAVLLRRQAPAETERWMLIRWLDTENTGLLNPEYMLKLRNNMTSVLYRTYDDDAWVVVDTVNHLQFDEVNFQNRFAWKMSGLWRMNDHSMGGPFVSYMFYDEGQKRLYFLDGSVFAPKYKKKKLIQDVDVMMKSFRTRTANGEGPSA